MFSMTFCAIVLWNIDSEGKCQNRHVKNWLYKCTKHNLVNYVVTFRPITIKHMLICTSLQNSQELHSSRDKLINNSMVKAFSCTDNAYRNIRTYELWYIRLSTIISDNHLIYCRINVLGPNIVTHKQITEFILRCVEMCIIYCIVCM